MKIIGLSLIKNESDIIESFVKVNLLILDELHIVDDGSSDDTLSILYKLIDSGYNVILHQRKNPTGYFYQQALNMTSLLVKLSEEKWDYALLLDADEFILSDRTELESDFGILSGSNYGLLKWRNFVPISANYFDSSDPLHEFFRPCSEFEEDKGIYKLVVPHGLAAETVLNHGSHDAANSSFQRGNWRELGTRLGHVPIRSGPQAILKGLVGFYIRSIKINRNEMHGFQYFEMMNEIRNKKYNLEIDDLQNFSKYYMADKYSNVEWQIKPNLDNGPKIPSIDKLEYGINPDLYFISVFDNVLREISEELVRKQWMIREFSRAEAYVIRYVNKRINRLNRLVKYVKRRVDETISIFWN